MCVLVTMSKSHDEQIRLAYANSVFQYWNFDVWVVKEKTSINPISDGVSDQRLLPGEGGQVIAIFFSEKIFSKLLKKI